MKTGTVLALVAFLVAEVGGLCHPSCPQHCTPKTPGEDVTCGVACIPDLVGAPDCEASDYCATSCEYGGSGCIPVSPLRSTDIAACLALCEMDGNTVGDACKETAGQCDTSCDLEDCEPACTTCCAKCYNHEECTTSDDFANCECVAPTCHKDCATEAHCYDFASDGLRDVTCGQACVPESAGAGCQADDFCAVSCEVVDSSSTCIPVNTLPTPDETAACLELCNVGLSTTDNDPCVSTVGACDVLCGQTQCDIDCGECCEVCSDEQECVQGTTCTCETPTTECHPGCEVTPYCHDSTARGKDETCGVACLPDDGVRCQAETYCQKQCVYDGTSKCVPTASSRSGTLRRVAVPKPFSTADAACQDLCQGSVDQEPCEEIAGQCDLHCERIECDDACSDCCSALTCNKEEACASDDGFENCHCAALPTPSMEETTTEEATTSTKEGEDDQGAAFGATLSALVVALCVLRV